MPSDPQQRIAQFDGGAPKVGGQDRSLVSQGDHPDLVVFFKQVKMVRCCDFQKGCGCGGLGACRPGSVIEDAQFADDIILVDLGEHNFLTGLHRVDDRDFDLSPGKQVNFIARAVFEKQALSLRQGFLLGYFDNFGKILIVQPLENSNGF